MRGILAPFRVAGRFLGVSAQKSKEYRRCAELWISFAQISRFFKSRKPETNESVKFSRSGGGAWSRGPGRPETALEVVTYQGIRGISEHPFLHDIFRVCGTLSAVFRNPEIGLRGGSHISRHPRNFGALACRVPLQDRSARKAKHIKASAEFGALACRVPLQDRSARKV